MSRGKIRWGDTLDDEDALPPTIVKGPDSHGLKTITEYFRNDKGDAVKKVTKIKVVTVERKQYKVRSRARPAAWACIPRHGAARVSSSPSPSSSSASSSSARASSAQRLAAAGLAGWVPACHPGLPGPPAL